MVQPISPTIGSSIGTTINCSFIQSASWNATQGDEVRKDTVTTGIRNGERINNGGYALLPAIPNPFNATTEFACIIPVKTELRVEIFNALGRRVRLIDEGEAEPGLYEYLWNGTDDAGTNLPGGLYFCRMTASGGVQVQRVMMVR